MATKNFMTLSNLTTYDGLIKQYIGTEDAKSIKSITVSGNTVSFYKTADASGTAAYTVNMPDVSGFISKITSATGSKVVASKTDGTIEESALAISDVATKSYADTAAQTAADGKDTAIQAAQDAADAAQDDVDALETLVGTIPAGATATTVVGYAAEVADAVADDLDTLDQSLASVAKSGAASDVSYDNTTSGLTADDVQEAIDELAEASAGGVASKTIYVTDESAGQSAYAKVYKIYQGENAPDAQTNPAQLKGTINIPKDKVLQDASIVDIVFVAADNSLHEGSASGPDVTELIKGSGTATSADAGKYLKMEMQNVANALYVNLQTFVDVYTVASGATEVQLALNNHEFSASIVEINGSKIADTSIAKTKLATAVQTSLGLADTAVQTVAEGATNGTIAVDGTDVAVHGLGSAAYAATTAFDASGAAATAKSEVIGTSGDAASADTINGAKAYADASTAAIATADIEALFA